METWTPLQPLLAEDWLTPATNELRAKLNVEIQAILDGRADLDREIAEFKNSTVEELSPHLVHLSTEMSFAKFGLCRDEFALRKVLIEEDGFYSLRSKDREAAYKKSYQAWLDVKAKVRAELADLGWVDIEPTAIEPSKITPGMVFSNARVRAAHARMMNLQTAALNAGQTTGDHRVAITQLEKYLSGYRDKLIAI